MHILETLHDFLWGAPALVMILGVGLWLTVRSQYAQFRFLPEAIRELLRLLTKDGRKDAGSGVSSFQALCTALAATVGTGNLVGVAGAICVGGPGSIFWMWLCGIIGMATKYAEAALAVRFRIQCRSGYVGGPMYTISRGMGRSWLPLAVMYSVFGLIASFGVGNVVQVNAAVSGLNTILHHIGIQNSLHTSLAFGFALAVLVGLAVFGGAKTIGRFSEVLVPAASLAYISLCTALLITHCGKIPGVLCDIVTGAFSPRAVTGGMIGSAFQVLRIGCARGVFTNEAGLGTASMAHAGAQVSHPCKQGIMGILEVYLDTLVICSLTALAILCSGAEIPYGEDYGAKLAVSAFSFAFGEWASFIIALCLIVFAYATIIGWGLYGTRCCEFLLGQKSIRFFLTAQVAAIFAGAVIDTHSVWLFAEVANGLMAIPNLISLAALSPEVSRLTKEYISGGTSADGGNYANIYQCEPL